MTTERQKWPSSVTTEFYISFEDALWSLLPRLGYKKGAVMLFPDFYCPDVLDNIRAHGYIVKTYPLEKNLGFSLEKVENAILRHKPDIFVDFAPAGIHSWISDAIFRKLPFHALLILDRVHSIIEPAPEFFPKNDRTLLINSYRKVSPFPGSHAVYSRSVRPAKRAKSFIYNLKGIVHWYYYLAFLKLAKVIRSPHLVVNMAEHRLRVHDNHIGDAITSSPLPKFFEWLPSHINVRLIKAVKAEQANQYLGSLSKHLGTHSRHIYLPYNSSDNFSEARGFPLILTEPYAKAFIRECLTHGLVVYPQLEDAVWSKKRKLILLPLGPHLKTNDIRNIAQIASKALTMVL